MQGVVLPLSIHQLFPKKGSLSSQGRIFLRAFLQVGLSVCTGVHNAEAAACVLRISRRPQRCSSTYPADRLDKSA